MIMRTYTHKRGDTFGRACAVTLDDRTWTAAAQLRRQGGDLLVADLDVSLVPYTGDQPPLPALPYTHVLSLSKSATVTVNWPIGALVCDVQFNDDLGNVLSSATFILKIIKDETHA